MSVRIKYKKVKRIYFPYFIQNFTKKMNYNMGKNRRDEIANVSTKFYGKNLSVNFFKDIEKVSNHFRLLFKRDKIK